MKTLSIMIDESGDFGELNPNNPSTEYLVTLVFHNQDDDISYDISRLDDSIKNSGFDIEYIHTGPIIRREDVFLNMSIDERRKLIYKMVNFYKHLPITHTTVVVDRRNKMDSVSLSGEIAKQLKRIIDSKQEFFYSFDKIEVFYDGGQSQLSAILNAVFTISFNNVEFKKAEPQKYRLLQVADFVCSMELLSIKNSEHRLSKSETQFFYKPQELKKSFFHYIDLKQLK